MADADLTYDFNEIPRFVAELDDGADLVMGDRMDNIQPGAMPWLHRYVGNPILSGFLNALYRTGVRDAHCGMRAIRRDKLRVLDLRTPGMEFASEMVIRAAKRGLDIRQFPIDYHPRGGESKLDTWSDGWRHLRFLLVHSPNHLFLIPGLVMTALGVLVMATAILQVNVFGRTWDIHAEIAGALFVIIGAQVVSLGLCAHAYGMYFLGEKDPWFDRMRSRFRLEHGLALGGITALVGMLIAAIIVGVWIDRGFGELGEERLAILAATLLIVGIQVFFSSFLLSIIGLRRGDVAARDLHARPEASVSLLAGLARRSRALSLLVLWGCGLLVGRMRRATGRRSACCSGSASAWSSSSRRWPSRRAPPRGSATPAVVAAGAGRHRARAQLAAPKIDAWAVAAVLGVFFVYAAPVVLAASRRSAATRCSATRRSTSWPPTSCLRDGLDLSALAGVGVPQRARGVLRRGLLPGRRAARRGDAARPRRGRHRLGLPALPGAALRADGGRDVVARHALGAAPPAARARRLRRRAARAALRLRAPGQRQGGRGDLDHRARRGADAGVAAHLP